MNGQWMTWRTARKLHRCGTESRNCVGRIMPGHRYIDHRAAPSDDLGNLTWWRFAECVGCAALYGRGEVT